ncbi:lipase family protein [Streptomyces sp. NPDC052299]|uniref:alpha/beta hydrolase family protein n=1 Tax=Streptomyces sp. NPDC052299 TaxID=3155054 RepID=UPI0034326DCF
MYSGKARSIAACCASGFLAALLAATPSAAAAGHGSGVPAGPRGEGFYHASRGLVEHGRHGTLIRAQRLTGVAAFAGADNWRVLYRSVTPQGRTVAVSGTVSIPHGRPPAGGWPVLSWLHGTTGVADACAPSRDTANGPAHDYLQAMQDTVAPWVARGYAVTRTDYQGLGTDGTHSYLVGEAEARAAADLTRAAHQLSGHLSDEWVAYGHSQGGHAAVFAADLANRWTPELRLLGAAALAPGSQLSAAVPALREQPIAGVSDFFPLIVRGAQTVRSMPDQDIFTPEALAVAGDADRLCIAQLRDPGSWGSLNSDEIFREGADLTALDKVLADNEPGLLSPRLPVLLAQGGKDTVIQPAWTAALDEQLRANGVHVTSYTYPEADHRGVLSASLPDVTRWIDQLFGRSSGDHSPTRP